MKTLAKAIPTALTVFIKIFQDSATDLHLHLVEVLHWGLGGFKYVSGCKNKQVSSDLQKLIDVFLW